MSGKVIVGLVMQAAMMIGALCVLPFLLVAWVLFEWLPACWEEADTWIQRPR